MFRHLSMMSLYLSASTLLFCSSLAFAQEFPSEEPSFMPAVAESPPPENDEDPAVAESPPPTQEEPDPEPEPEMTVSPDCPAFAEPPDQITGSLDDPDEPMLETISENAESKTITREKSYTQNPYAGDEDFTREFSYYSIEYYRRECVDGQYVLEPESKTIDRYDTLTYHREATEDDLSSDLEVSTFWDYWDYSADESDVVLNSDWILNYQDAYRDEVEYTTDWLGRRTRDKNIWWTTSLPRDDEGWIIDCQDLGSVLYCEQTDYAGGDIVGTNAWIE